MLRKFAILMALAGGSCVPALLAAQQPGGHEGWPGSLPQRSAGFAGDPGASGSDEARAMSPPHWGSDEPYWPNASPVRGPGCDTAGLSPAGPQSRSTGHRSPSRFVLPPPPPAGSSGPASTPAPAVATGPTSHTTAWHHFVPQSGPAGTPLPPWPVRNPQLDSQWNNRPEAYDQAQQAAAGRMGGRPAEQLAAGRTRTLPVDPQSGAQRYPLFGPGTAPAGHRVPERPRGHQEPASGDGERSVLEGPALGEPDAPPQSNKLPDPVPRFRSLPDDVPEPPQGVIVPNLSFPAPPSGASGDGPVLSGGPEAGIAVGIDPVGCEDWERGFRSGSLTVRPQTWDDGTAYDFEGKKKEYPPMKEILATGRYFGMAEWQILKPFFLNNPGLTAFAPGTSNSIQHDFDTESAPRFRAGFESKYGPGIELTYSQFDHLSDTVSFTSDGIANGFSAVNLSAPGATSRLETASAGERIESRHDLELHQLGASFYKEVRMPISRLNGIFGFRYVSIAQNFTSRVVDAGGTETGSLLSQSDLRAVGPTLGLEYYRPMGHTPLELIGAFNGAVLFGNRDHHVQNAGSLDYNSIGSNEFLSVIDFFAGLQHVQQTAEKRSWYLRMGFSHQLWLGGGTASDPGGDFGLRGITFAAGLNR